MASTEDHKLHNLFLPFAAHGHMIPMLDMARLFASRGVRSTIVTTPQNFPLVSKSIGQPEKPDTIINIKILTIRFPSVEAGLPEGCENIDSLTSPSLVPAFFKATRMLQDSVEQILPQNHLDCVIAGVYFPWATDSAAKFGIPRIVFHGTGSFSLCASECMPIYQPHKNVLSDSEPFVIKNLPGEIKITRMVLPDFVKNDDDDENEWTRMQKAKESELKSFGVLVNSFYELEKVYADHYKNEFGRKTWHVGPVSLLNRDVKEKANRGKEASIDEQECLKWLDSKKPNSVVYVCFGSIANFPES